MVQKASLVGALVASLAGLSLGDKVVFTQCDCPSLNFGAVSPISGVNLANVIGSNSQVGNLFTCTAAQQGVDVAIPASTALTGLTSTASKGLVNNGGVLGTFYIMTQFTYKTLVAGSRSRILSFKDGSLISIVCDGFRNGNQFIMSGSATVDGGIATFQHVLANYVDNQVVTLMVGYDNNGSGDVTSAVFFGTASTPATFSLFNNPAATANDISIELMSSVVTNNGAFGAKVHYFEVGKGKGSSATLSDFFVATNAAFVKPRSIPVQKASPPALQGDEDSVITVDLSTQITNIDGATVTYTANIPTGTFSAADVTDGSFSYTPVFNFNGNVAFTYTTAISDSSCALSFSNSISVLPTEDIPVITTPVITINDNIFAGIDVTSALLSVSVATDPDDAGGLLDGGFLTVTSLPQGTLFRNLGCTNQVTLANPDLSVTQGKLAPFCYRPPSTLGTVAENTDTFTYTIRDAQGNNAAGSGTINLVRKNPLQPVSPNVFGTEDNTLTINFFGATPSFGTNNAPGQTKVFSVLLQEVPSALFGSLKRGNTVLAAGATIVSGDAITFVPADGFYNSNGTNPITVDGLGNALVPECPEEIAANNCPALIKFKLVNNGVQSDEVGQAKVYFQAVDDAGVSIDDAPTLLTVVSGETTDLGKVKFSSDDGGETFPIIVKITSADGVDFRWNPDVSGKSFSGIIASKINIDESTDCQSKFCEAVVVRGVPGVLEELLDTVVVRGKEDPALDQPRLVIEASNVNGEANPRTALVSVEFNQKEKGFFDDPTNVYLVAGAGGAAGIFILGLFFLRSRSGGAKLDEERLLDVAEKAVEIELRGKNKKVETTKASTVPSLSKPIDNKKSLKIDVNDEIFDWEKHIDKESGEVYFFNPKTGESQWDPPKVKSYNL